jgi:enediyne biosynthesis protein E4
MIRIAPYIFVAFCLLISCTNSDKPTASRNEKRLFTLMPADSTQVFFNNELTEGLNTNVLMYEYFYNGAGVGIGDFNSDGLQDIYFVGNMTPDKLYLNRGNLRFEDITTAANIKNRSAMWRTGVTVSDINADGKPDIYVSHSGKVRATNRIPQLFINKGNDNNGIPRFEDEAQQYGLADTSYATQSFFFDYDRDGDLDMLALNHNPDNLPVLDDASTANLLTKSDRAIGIRLFKNDNGRFADATQGSGINSSVLTYGLGAAISDINGDGWPDVYIANDYNVPDYLYINNRNGTFTDKIQTALGHISKSSMGNNVADINNDGLPDIFVLDMLPEDNHRQKVLFASDNYERFDITVRSGFHYQYMRNMLHLNNGDGSFSEIGQLAGISNTDWSWAPLFADFDNDGWKDLYVTNGYTRDFTDMDFLKYKNTEVQSKGRLNREQVMEILRQMPASNVTNYIYKNNGQLGFDNMGGNWGIDTPSNSNGAAYADFDNDGDLDLVVNNINRAAFIYRNEAGNQTNNHYLQVKLKGAGKNTEGLGAKLTLYSKGKLQFQEQMPARGYQSTVSPVLHFGLGEATVADSLRVVWLTGKEEVVRDIKANQVITLDENNAKGAWRPSPAPSSIMKEVKAPFVYKHASTDLNDFKRQPLLINPLSYNGPCLIKGDVNGDGLEDIFAGGGSGQAAMLFLQQKGGSFVQKPQAGFETDKNSEDAGAAFFDANGDGSIDLYVASGGYNNYLPNDPLLQDRLYLNDGKGNFTRKPDALPDMLVSKSCVRVSDINGDGFTDVFVGGRVIPGRYPETPASFLLLNDGKGKFTDHTSTIAPALKAFGMITDAAWTDLNGDKKSDLVLVGEWMPVSVFINAGGKLENKTKDYFTKEYSGWWNKLYTGDFNKDGKTDFVIGNTGLNTQCRASDKEPAEMFYKDFDNNGAVDPIFCFYIQGKSYPYVTRDELLDQVSLMRARFTDYKSYADASLQQVFLEEELKDAQKLQANYLATAYFESGADGKFIEKKLPVQAQYSPVFAIASFDYDKDGNNDLLLCGNINKARLRFGKYDANYGVLLKNDGKGNFTYIGQQHSGLSLRGDVRSIITLDNTLLFGINQQPLKAYKW